MCGILGIHGYKASEAHLSLDILIHRGPDGHGISHCHESTLGHTRLAIIDVPHGAQPLTNQEETHYLICNGEIYNHENLRERFSDYPFKTHSDSEIILALYAHYGTDAVKHLDGMFAFALVDGDDFYMARDPLGIKPLYYGFSERGLHFASEMKCLQNDVEEIREFPPGHWYTPEHGFVRYYDLESINEKALARQRTKPAGTKEIAASLHESVRKRLMSDVPLGVLLSGGLDSSILAALASEYIPHVHSFAVGMEGSDDIPRARQVAEHLGTQHHECIYTVDDMIRVLPDVIYYLETFEPSLVQSAIPNFMISELASKYVKVVLCGEGADELHAGYHYLKELSGNTLQNELVALTTDLHNLNLQRCDRMTMAHNLEGRVPFLDTDFIETSLSVPLDQKIHGPEEVEKWALRKAFGDKLPKEIVWRVKEQFADGAGSANIFEKLAEKEISDRVFEQEKQVALEETGYTIRNKEELYYYRIFRQHFPNPTSVATTGQWRGKAVTAPKRKAA